MLLRMMKASRPQTTTIILRGLKLHEDHERTCETGVQGLALGFGIQGRGVPDFSDGVDGCDPYGALMDDMTVM